MVPATELVGECAIAVRRMQAAKPEGRVGTPLLRRVAENGLDLRAGVEPLSRLARLRGVHDPGYPLDQGAIALEDLQLGIRRRQGRPDAGSTAVGSAVESLPCGHGGASLPGSDADWPFLYRQAAIRD